MKTLLIGLGIVAIVLLFLLACVLIARAVMRDALGVDE
jgi:hypothetical protein